jgi:electron transfer flavoprotein-quinone oxidoreductase
MPHSPGTNQQDFQAIVVGAGPAGTAAAYTLAKAGVKTALIERGSYPGAKNVMGGILYTEPVSEIIPNFWEQAPLERPLIQQEFLVLSDGASTAVKHQNAKFAKAPYNRYSVLRAKFDAWFAKQAEETGVYLINKTVVKELLYNKGQVVGIRTDRPEGDLYAPVIILADGVNSILAQQAGLGSKIEPKNVALAVKEIVALPENKINERFNLEKGFGAAIDIYGNIARGMAASGFIYTNKDSLSVGLGIMLDDLAKARIAPYELLEEMKNHPTIREILADGEPREYMAHMIPEGGYQAMPKLYDAGVMVVGDAASMVNALHHEGANLAMTSGKLAAETAIGALEKQDFSRRVLAGYEHALRNSYVLQDLKKYKRFPAFMHSRPYFFSVLPEVLNASVSEFFTVDGTSKKKKFKQITQDIKSRISFWRLMKDAWQGWRAI